MGVTYTPTRVCGCLGCLGFGLSVARLRTWGFIEPRWFEGAQLLPRPGEAEGGVWDAD